MPRTTDSGFSGAKSDPRGCVLERSPERVVGEVWFRAADHQLVRPVIIVRGKAPNAMKNKEDFWEIEEIVPGEGLMQAPDAFGCNLGTYT